MNGQPRAWLVALAALLLATTGALSWASTASADSGPMLSLDIHALGVGDTVTVSSSGWDPGTTVSFSTDPPDSPPTIVDAVSDGAGAVADFQITVTGSALAAGSTTTWTLTASGTAGGVGATAQDSASVKGPTDPQPGDYQFTAPAADTTTTLRATSTASTTLAWTRTVGATGGSLSITTYRATQSGEVCPTAISSYTSLAPVSVPGASTSSIVTGLAKGYCYRFGLTVLAVDIIGSGTVRVLPGTPVVATWSGGFNLYRTSSFSTQATFTWCAPASVQMMLNLDRHASDHSSSRQRIYYDYGRSHRANPFYAPGLDPQAWMLVLNRYGTVKYLIVTSRSLATLLRTVATRIRLTGSPAGLVVGSGSHAWVVQGFSAASDPAKGTYTLRGVYTMGPLWPKQTRTHGYFDLRPNTYLTVATMARLTGTYHDPEGHTRWDGLYVAIVP